MKIKSLIEHLKDYPEDAEICLSRCISITDDESYECHYHSPIIGTAINKDEDEVLFMVGSHNKSMFSKVEMLK